MAGNAGVIQESSGNPPVLVSRSRNGFEEFNGDVPEADLNEAALRQTLSRAKDLALSRRAKQGAARFRQRAAAPTYADRIPVARDQSDQGHSGPFSGAIAED